MTSLNPMKSILYWSPDYYLGPETPTDYDQTKKREVRKRCIVTKYFPKYLKKIYLDLKNGPLKSKLKRTKVIQELQYPYAFFNRSYWKVLLANKIKTLKTLTSYHQSPHQFAQKIMIFPGLKSLSVSLPGQIGSVRALDKIREKYFKIAFKRINGLRNLQSLFISKLSKDHKDSLEKLNSFSRLLMSLTTLCITYDEPKSFDSELLNIIQSKKNIINSVTSLALGSLCSPSLHMSFQNLADSCPKLQRLRFEFSNRNVTYPLFGGRYFAEKTFPVEVNYLAALNTSHNLRSLHLNIADTFTCLKDLVLPPLIQNLALNFQECLSQEIMLKIDPAFSNSSPQVSKIFEENETLLQFYDRFRCFDRLETLNIHFSIDSDSESYQYQNYLLHSLFKRIPATLRKLTSRLLPHCPGLNRPSGTSQRNPYLPQFFDACHNFSQTLQTLEIGHERILYSNLDLSASHAQFPQLSSIRITGKFEEYKALNPPILPFLEQLVSLGDSLVKIKLLFQMDNAVKSVVSLLQQISQFKMPTKLYLEMEVKFFGVKDLEDLEAGFEDVINELGNPENRSLKAKRTSMKMYTTKSSEEMKKFLSVFGERFEHFEVCPKNFVI